MNMVIQALFQLLVAIVGSVGSAICASLYFRRVRLDRPPVGRFNNRDIVVLLFFIVALPFWYLVMPSWLLIGFLLLTFTSALYMALRPFLLPRFLWPLIACLVVVNIIVTETLLGTRSGWQLYWVITDAIVLCAIVGVSNLYVQGGLRLSSIAWFALVLGFYDAFFSLVIPLTQKLADRFEGQPLDPSIGFAMGPYNANLGIGDLLVFTLFIVAAYKGYGRKGIIAAMIIIPLFGAIIPALAPLAVSSFVRSTVGIVVPVQSFFGPAAFISYL